MGQLGADVEQLDRLSAAMAGTARSLRTTISSLNASIGTAVWHGPDADGFRSTWRSEHRRVLQRQAEVLAELADAITAQADQQRLTSTGGASLIGGPFGPSGPLVPPPSLAEPREWDCLPGDWEPNWEREWERDGDQADRDRADRDRTRSDGERRWERRDEEWERTPPVDRRWAPRDGRHDPPLDGRNTQPEWDCLPEPEGGWEWPRPQPPHQDQPPFEWDCLPEPEGGWPPFEPTEPIEPIDWDCLPEPEGGWPRLRPRPVAA